MARKIRKKGLKQYSEKELLEEIARRHADAHYREGMTMSAMELSAEATPGHRAPPTPEPRRPRPPRRRRRRRPREMVKPSRPAVKSPRKPGATPG